MEIDRETAAYKRAFAAGFILTNSASGELDDGFKWAIISFHCVCGKEEHDLIRAQELPYLTGGNKMGFAAHLENSGNFSVDHLKRDGFSDDEIKKIRAPYEE